MFNDRSCEIQLSVIRRLPRHCPIVFWLTFFIACGCFGLSHSSFAGTFVFESGETVQGRVILVTRDAVTIERVDGGLHEEKIADIREVRLDTQNGRSIVGRFLGWSSNGVYEIESDGQVARIRDGQILSGKARRAATDETNPSVPTGQENLAQIAQPQDPSASKTTDVDPTEDTAAEMERLRQENQRLKSEVQRLSELAQVAQRQDSFATKPTKVNQTDDMAAGMLRLRQENQRLEDEVQRQLDRIESVKTLEEAERQDQDVSSKKAFLNFLRKQKGKERAQ